jgi:hypothetical protein
MCPWLAYPINYSSLPDQARLKAGCQPKSEGATATERGQGRYCARSVYKPVRRSKIVYQAPATDGGRDFYVSFIFNSFYIIKKLKTYFISMFLHYA